MSIKSFVSACLAAVGALLAVMAILLFFANWHAYRSARDAGQLVELLGASTRISETMAPERGATIVSLDGDSAARKSLVETRAKLDGSFAAAEKEAAASSVPEFREAAVAMARLRATINDWRAKADAVTGGAPPQLAAFRQDFYSGIHEALSTAGGITAKLGRQLSSLDPEVGNPASLAETAWQLRDQAGQISILHIAAIGSGHAFTAGQVREMTLAEARVQQLWERMTALAGSPDSPAGLRDSVAKVEAGYILPFAALCQRADKAGLSDGAYDLNVVEWRRQSAPMLQSIMLMRDAAIAEAHRVSDDKSARALRDLIVSGALLGLAAATLAAVVVGINRRVLLPLARLTAIIGDFAEGSRDFAVPFADRHDETGRMAKAIEVLRDNAHAADRRTAQEAVAARGRDEQRQRVEGVTAGFVASIDAVVGGVATTVGGLRGATDTLSAASGIAVEQSTVVAAAAEHASSNVETVAAAAEELSHSIQEIARQVAETASAMDGAVQEAEATNAIVRGLAEAAQRIGDVVSLITHIASQTNLLALNATIEAARAGEAGKGFAVVAGEVKNLANQTARATGDIQTQVAAIQAETNRAVEAIAGIGTTIATVNQYTIGIASAVTEQGAATREIARNVQQAAAGTAEVSQSIGRVLEAERQTGAAAVQLSGLASRLSQESERLRGNVGEFVAEVKKG